MSQHSLRECLLETVRDITGGAAKLVQQRAEEDEYVLQQ